MYKRGRRRAGNASTPLFACWDDGMMFQDASSKQARLAVIFISL